MLVSMKQLAQMRLRSGRQARATGARVAPVAAPAKAAMHMALSHRLGARLVALQAAETEAAPEPETADAAEASNTASEGAKGGRRRRFRRRRSSKAVDPNKLVQKAWYAEQEYTVQTLYEELLRRCEQGETGEGPLYHAVKIAATPEDARIVLSAFAALRTVRLAKQTTPPTFGSKLVHQLTQMMLRVDAPDVLAEALKRATELGCLFSGGAVHQVLKVWGGRSELAKVEEVLAAMPLGGVKYSTDTAYVIVRTAIATGNVDRAEYYAQAMLDRQVRLSPTTLRMLEAAKAGGEQQ